MCDVYITHKHISLLDKIAILFVLVNFHTNQNKGFRSFKSKVTFIRTLSLISKDPKVRAFEVVKPLITSVGEERAAFPAIDYL